LRANRWDRTVNITRVEQHSILTLEFFVDPLGPFRFDDVVDVISTQLPGLDVSWDVKS
jgi:hypothetical protein